MEQDMQEKQINQETLQNLMMRAYHLGHSDKDITARKLLDDLVGELKKIIAK
jgi:hypothetical protein